MTRHWGARSHSLRQPTRATRPAAPQGAHRARLPMWGARRHTHKLAFCLALALSCCGFSAAAAAAASCSFACAAHATCNEAERRCDCAPGLAGADCSQLAVPSCVLREAALPALAAQAPPAHSRSCACIREWLVLLQAQPAGVSWASAAVLAEDVACWDAPPGTPVLDVWAAAAAGELQQSRMRVRGRNTTGVAQVSLLPLQGDAERRKHGLDVAPMHLCPANCSLHGFCTRRMAGLLRVDAFPDGKPHCVCWGGRLGNACERPPAMFPKDGSPWCLNGCRGRGACVRGTCACERGFWGPDCSVTASGLLQGRGPALQPKPPPGLPAVYVYDLPPPLVSWHLWLTWLGIRADWGRTAGWRFLETALRSAARVSAAADATLFVMPVAGARDVNRTVAFEHVRRAYPHLDANIAAGRGPNHVWPIMPADGGLGSYDGVVPSLLRSRNGSAGELPDFFQHSIFLSHHSLHLGYTRGFAVESRTWWPVPPAKEMPPMAYAGLFVPGKDVYAAAADKQSESCRSLPELLALNKTHRVWWAGSVRPRAGKDSARAVVASLLGNVSGFAITTHGGANEVNGMRQSEFCLVLPGTGGGYGSRDARALSRGCAPVYIQDHTSQPMDELLPISLYGLAVAEADIGLLPSMLNKSVLVRDRPAALAQLACACRALRWPWVATEHTTWGELREDELALQDVEGGWASLLQLLERRQRGAGPLHDACAAVPEAVAGALSPPPPRQLHRQLQRREKAQGARASQRGQAAPSLTLPTQVPRTAPAAADGNTQCGAYSQYLRSIHEDLTPWAGSGITAEMMDEAHQHTMQRNGEHGLSFLLRAGQLYVINGQRSDFDRLGRAARLSHIKWLLTYVRVLQRLAETDGAALSDVEFVVEQGDGGPKGWGLDKPDSVRPPWSVRRSVPLLRYCKSDDRPEILIPYHHFYERKLSATFLQADGLPWEARKDVLFGKHHGYGRAADTVATARVGADGLPLPAWAGGSTRRYMANLSAWAGPEWVAAAAGDDAGNVTAASGVVRMEINRQSMPMLEWGRYKYLLHLDGVTCSSKLEQELPLGSLVFKEESGYRSFFHRLLVPYQHYVPFWRHRPQELLDALAWARAHNDEARAIAAAGQQLARHFFSRDGLRCYWVLLLREYATLQRFVPGARLKASQLVPAKDYMDWARAADGATGAVFIEDIELA